MQPLPTQTHSAKENKGNNLESTNLYDLLSIGIIDDEFSQSRANSWNILSKTGVYECILFLYKRGAKHRVYDKRETKGCMLTITYNVSEKISLTLFMKHEITHPCAVNGQRETTSVLIVVIDSVKAVTSSCLSFSFSSKLSMIVRVNVVLNRTVVVDSD